MTTSLVLSSANGNFCEKYYYYFFYYLNIMVSMVTTGKTYYRSISICSTKNTTVTLLLRKHGCFHLLVSGKTYHSTIFLLFYICIVRKAHCNFPTEWPYVSCSQPLVQSSNTVIFALLYHLPSSILIRYHLLPFHTK